MSSVWLYYNGAKAGLTRWEVRNIPIGMVLDQIACYQIAECGAIEVNHPAGSLFEQMSQIKKRR